MLSLHASAQFSFKSESKKTVWRHLQVCAYVCVSTCAGSPEVKAGVISEMKSLTSAVSVGFHLFILEYSR